MLDWNCRVQNYRRRNPWFDPDKVGVSPGPRCELLSDWSMACHLGCDWSILFDHNSARFWISVQFSKQQQDKKMACSLLTFFFVILLWSNALILQELWGSGRSILDWWKGVLWRSGSIVLKGRKIFCIYTLGESKNFTLEVSESFLEVRHRKLIMNVCSVWSMDNFWCSGIMVKFFNLSDSMGTRLTIPKSWTTS